MKFSKRKRLKTMLNKVYKMGFYHGEYCANEGAMPPEIRGQSELYALEAKLYIEHILNQLP